MNSEPQVNIEGEKRATHWFKKTFYKKDGGKDTLLSKKAALSCLGLFVIVVAIAMVQGTSQPISMTQSQIGEPRTFTEGQKVDLPDSALFAKDAIGYLPVGGEKKSKKYGGPQLVIRPRIPIPAGAMVRAKLIAGATNGPVRAEIIDNLSAHGETIVEQGTLLMGTGNSSSDRLQVRFTQLVFKDGGIQSVQGTVYDPDDKMPGLKGSQLGNNALKLAGSLGLNFVGGFSEGFQDSQVTAMGTVVKQGTLKNALLNGTAQTALDESREMMSSLRNSQPIFAVPEGKEVLVAFDGGQ